MKEKNEETKKREVSEKITNFPPTDQERKKKARKKERKKKEKNKETKEKRKSLRKITDNMKLQVFSFLLRGEKESRKRKKKRTGFSILLGSKTQIILDTIINVTLV